MKTIRLIFGSIFVYLAVAVLHACSPTSSAGHGAKDSGAGGVMDPVDKAAADPVSGSRLKAYYQTGEDGSKAYLGGAWYDSDRDEDCTFTRASDSVIRCMPFGNAAETNIFANPSCTSQPLLRFDSPCGPPKYASTIVTLGCDGSKSVNLIYGVGGKMLPDKIYVGTPDNCSEAVPDALGTYYATGPEIPAETFVAGKRAHD